MREPGEIVAAFPRPGRVLKAVLVLLGVLAIVGAIVFNWAPGGPRGEELIKWLAFEPEQFLKGGHGIPRVWTLVTSGLLTDPQSLSHVVFSMIGLYFLTTDLEKRWGSARLFRFLFISVVMGNLAVLGGWLIPTTKGVFHPPVVLGPLAAIVATAIAWSKENAQRQIRFMFFVPMSGRTLFWVTIGVALLAILFLQGAPEGALAGIGGITAGLLFSGTPSPIQAFLLRARLGRRRSKITVEDLLQDAPARPRAVKRGKSPALRVVPGGLEEDLKNRKPPKDKRYLN
jgi:membrane associated rhomboid family serine protease